jgi:Rps23 Pro-64 3,4-dihydroxylase Tpa1-like proline 4-hydroxylase
LADNGYVVVEDFLPAELQEALRKDVHELRSCEKFQIAKIGNDGMIQDENSPFRDIRYSETCFIGRINEPEVKCKARTELYGVLDQLKSVLDTNDVVKHGHLTGGVPRLDTEMEELMYAYYPQGGYYRRHRDAEPDSVSNWRKYSLLLYLNHDWTSKDGGELRIHRDSGGDELPVGELPNFMDVHPESGTLVLFRSDMCPHEVLDTRKERIATRLDGSFPLRNQYLMLKYHLQQRRLLFTLTHF